MRLKPSLCAFALAGILSVPAQGHYVSSNCSTSKLGGGTCQKHSHPHRAVPSMSSGGTYRAPAMGIDGDANLQASRVKVGQEKESCGFLKALFIGC